MKDSKTDIKQRMDNFIKDTEGMPRDYELNIVRTHPKTGKVLEIRRYNWKPSDEININDYTKIYEHNTPMDFAGTLLVPEKCNIYLDSCIEK